MTRDYAKKPAAARRPAKRRAPQARRPSDRRPVWSAPSFSAGAIFGAACVLLASYAPSAFQDTVVAVREPVTQPEQIDFEFDQILANDTVEADPSAYPAEFPGEDPDAPPPEYVIQAISVRSSETAATLTAELRRMGMNSTFERADLSSGTWYRVMVGPFNTRVEATRAMTELRKRNMTPRLSKVG
ncbi:MAG: SPOR domain-containing protein [Pseudomonadales bacterium]|jgi:cell division protein FtsN